MMRGGQRVLLFLKGMAMGAADSVPGVSGGTIAFIANIYDELLASIMAFNPASFRILRQHGLPAAWRAINGNFLLTLSAGLLVALVISANLVVYLLEQRYTYLMCFFTGLIVASVWYVGSQISGWNLRRCLFFAAGLALSVMLALLPQFDGSNNLAYYFVCGAIAICAMILPGISGAFILLLLGAYEPVMNALTSTDWPIILVFAAGCICGLLSFARVLHWLLNNYRPATLAGLLGILVGSLYTLWPWREAIPADPAAGEHVLQQFRNIMPVAVDAMTGMEISLVLCLLLSLAGFLLVWGLETMGSK